MSPFAPAVTEHRNSSIRILLADDHPVVRIGVRNMLRAEGNFDVVGEASDGDEAITQTLEKGTEPRWSDEAPHMRRQYSLGASGHSAHLGRDRNRRPRPSGHPGRYGRREIRDGAAPATPGELPRYGRRGAGGGAGSPCGAEV